MTGEPRIQISALVLQESHLAAVALPILDIHLMVGNVEITENDCLASGLVRCLTQRIKPCGHVLQERVLRHLLGRIELPGVHICRHHGDRTHRAVQVNFDPAP